MTFDFYYLLTFMAVGMVGSLFFRLFQFKKRGGAVVYAFQADKKQRMILSVMFVALTVFYFYYEMTRMGTSWQTGLLSVLPFWALWWIYFGVYIAQTPKIREHGIQAATTYFDYEKVIDMHMEPGRKSGTSRLHLVAETKKGRRRDVYLSVVGDRSRVETELKKFGFLKSKKKKKKK
jgi:uncharacterized membrane protein YobD (UPF0266 family)